MKAPGATLVVSTRITAELLLERLRRVPWHSGATLDAFDVQALLPVLRMHLAREGA
jgi:hypothetical protein